MALQTTDYLPILKGGSKTLCNITVDQFQNSIETDAKVRVRENAPPSAVEGDLYWDETTAQMYVYYGNQGGIANWVPATPVPDMSSSVKVRQDPPSDAVEGDIYWDTDDARMYVYYNNGGDPTWVPTTPVPKASEIDGGLY